MPRTRIRGVFYWCDAIAKHRFRESSIVKRAKRVAQVAGGYLGRASDKRIGEQLAHEIRIAIESRPLVAGATPVGLTVNRCYPMGNVRRVALYAVSPVTGFCPVGSCTHGTALATLRQRRFVFQPRVAQVAGGYLGRASDKRIGEQLAHEIRIAIESRPLVAGATPVGLTANRCYPLAIALRCPIDFIAVKMTASCRFLVPLIFDILCT